MWNDPSCDSDNIYFDIETIELERNGATYDTIQLLKETKIRIQEYYFIIGGDMVDYLPTWHRVDGGSWVQFVGVNPWDTKKKHRISAMDYCTKNG